MSEALRNWAGNLKFSTEAVHVPQSMEQLQDLVRGSTNLRSFGARHSFNAIADCSGDLVSTEKLDRVMELDRQNQQVRVSAATRYGDLAKYLFANGFALHNLASLPHISVAGACATATHGSGDRNGNLATAVSGLELVTATGAVVQLSRELEGECFDGAVVSMGGLGVVTAVTLDLLQTFEVAQFVFENLPVANLCDHFDEIMSCACSVSLFTDWQSDDIKQVWVKRRVADYIAPDYEFYGAKPAKQDLHPIAGISADNCTTQMGIPGSWHERLPHFRMEFTPSSGEELQTEYFVPRNKAVAALLAVGHLGKELAPFILTSEIRSVAGDNLWMSPCYQQDSIGIHFTWKPNWTKVKELLPKIEEYLAPFDARPHWGKLFTMKPRCLQSLYARLPDFRGLLEQYDPTGKFRNDFIDTYISAE